MIPRFTEAGLDAHIADMWDRVGDPAPLYASGPQRAQMFDLNPHHVTLHRDTMPPLPAATKCIEPLPQFDVERESPRMYLLIALAGVVAGALSPIVFDWIVQWAC